MAKYAVRLKQYARTILAQPIAYGFKLALLVVAAILVKSAIQRDEAGVVLSVIAGGSISMLMLVGNAVWSLLNNNVDSQN